MKMLTQLAIIFVIFLAVSAYVLNGVNTTEIKEEEIEMVTHVHAKHILVKTFPEAQELEAELKNGATFEKLAEMKSTCSSGKKGGDLGWFGRGQMVKEFETVAFSLGKGEISKPFKSQFGWHLMKVIDKR